MMLATRTLVAILCLASLPCFALAEEPAIAGEITLLGAVDTGRGFLEGPAAAPDGRLFYTDIPNTKILVLATDGSVSVFTDQSRHSNGLMFNAAGELIACEMDGQVVAWDIANKTRRVLAASYNGTRFNAPNDLVIDRQGGIYFTDPRFRAPQPLPQGVQGVYYLAPDGSVTRVVESLPAPNGILLSPDERTLYVFPSDSWSMRAYEVKLPGKLAAGREFCQLGRPGQKGRSGADGATIDTTGNVYITCSQGVQVVSPLGKTLRVIGVPEKPANVTFLGSRLYMTARKSLYAFDTKAEGHQYPAGESAPTP
ncbi:MAG: SMP-30/gluconolactonase/LRE family protein [Planctomycetota bacterium]